MISVIVPVYNVEKYVEKCLDSLINQTYKNIEIIVINDGSTDRSGDICRQWAEKEQLIYISKSNEGLGPTRTLGLKMARGEFVMFVDSDDWLAPNAIEVLVDQMKKDNSADVITITRFYEYDNNNGDLKEKCQGECIGVDLICDEKRKGIYLLYGFVMMCGKLFRRKFLLGNDILIPNIPYEDVGVFPQIVFNAKSIGFCDKPVYYYRANRKGSIISDSLNRVYMAEACENFLKYFKSHNIFELYYSPIKRFMEREIKNSYDIYCQCVLDKRKQILVLNNFMKIHKKYFGNHKPYWEFKFILLGSFGCRWIIHQLAGCKEKLIYHIPFSSLIAQGSFGEIEKYKIYNRNIFRKEKIAEDLEGNLYSVLEKSANECDFFFIDFLEERYDVAKLDDGNYMTLSEALEDSDIEGLNIKQIIRTNTPEHSKVWKSKCKMLVEFIKNKFESKQIVLIKSRLATSYLEEGKLKDYPERDQLEEKNHMIEKMENYFISLMGEEIQIYSYPKKIYSDKKFRMGAKPNYLSDIFYLMMNAEISSSLDYR